MGVCKKELKVIIRARSNKEIINHLLTIVKDVMEYHKSKDIRDMTYNLREVES